MLSYGEKPDYSRHEVTKYLSEFDLNISGREDIDLDALDDWVDRLKRKRDKLCGIPIKIRVNIYEESEGFGYGTDVAHLEPCYDRIETDEEYKERIKEEDEEYRRYLKAEEARATNRKQYEKDLEEYKRIKEKYGLL